MRQLRVFASFDCENDEHLLRRLVAESKDPKAPFEVFDRSAKEPFTPETAERLCQRISNVDAVIVLCGPWTHLSPTVNAEVKMAQELNKRYYLVKGRRFGDCSRPATARISDKMYKWGRDTTAQLVLRNI